MNKCIGCGSILQDTDKNKDGYVLDINDKLCQRCFRIRYYNEYKTPAEGTEATRYTVLDGGLILNTPIVMYSWKPVVNALMKENIVTKKDNVYYITDMNKLINYILESKKWSTQ